MVANAIDPWVVRPETKNFEDLVWTDPDGNDHKFSIELKKRLNNGERKRLGQAGFDTMRQQGQRGADSQQVFDINWERLTYAKVQIYLVDWSLRDGTGAKKDFKSVEVLNALDPDLFKIIEDTIDTHAKEMDAELEAQKKAKTLSMEPATT